MNPSHRSRAWSLLASIAIATAVAPRSLAAAETALRLTWSHIEGKPGARDRVSIAGSDTSRVDTLYLAFEVPRPTPAIASMSALVYFRPQSGDTLGDFWSFKTGQPNGGALLVDFPPFADDKSSPAPWDEAGDYAVAYDRIGGAGRLSFEHTLKEINESHGLEPGPRYCFARVRIAHRGAQLSGHRQPVCVEWANAKITFTTGRQLLVRGGEGRIAGWNAGPDCVVSRPASSARPWMPKPRGR